MINLLEWMIIIWLIMFLLYWLSVKMSAKWLNKHIVNAVGVYGTMGKGKDAFMVGSTIAIAKKRRCNVYSNIPIDLSGKKNGDYSKLLKPEYVELNKLDSQFPLDENDIVYISEAGIEFPSDDYKGMGMNKMGVAMYIKFIRHINSGTFFFNEQDPNRVWIQIREKAHSHIKIERMKKGLFFPFFIHFDITLYTNLDDYGIVLPTKREIKKGIRSTPTFKGEIQKKRVRFWKSSIFGNYDTRAFSLLGDIKRAVYENRSGKLSSDDVITYSSLTIDDSNIDHLNLDKFAALIGEFKENNLEEEKEKKENEN